MAVQSGKDLLVKLDLTGDGQFETIAGLRATRISFNAETVDVTSLESAGGWRELLAGAGVRSASISGSGVFRDADTDERARQIFFAGDQYWIKDLTGSNSVTINSMPIAGQAALQPDMQIALSPQGPRFRFLGGGRLAEVQQAPPATPEPPPQTAPAPGQDAALPKAQSRKSGSLFKKFFS